VRRTRITASIREISSSVSLNESRKLAFENRGLGERLVAVAVLHWPPAAAFGA
jgi:hypothetical protein